MNDIVDYPGSNSRDSSRGARYWHILLFDIDEEAAHGVLALAKSAGLIPNGGEVTDPHTTLTLGLDRSTAEWLKAALSEVDTLVTSEDGLSKEKVSPKYARSELETIVDDLDEFLGLE